MTIEYQMDVPMPESKRRNSVYPWDMPVGASFFVAGMGHNTISGRAQYKTKTLGFKYSMHKVTEDGVTGIRVWRIE